MATGKTNARWITIDLDDSAGAVKDITTGVLDISGVGLTYEESDVTGYSDGVKNFTLGHPSSEIDLTCTVDNTAAVGAYTVCAGIVGDQGANSPFTLTVQFGIRATPAGGDPEFEGEYYCSSLVMNGDGTFTARLVPGSATAPAFGTV